MISTITTYSAKVRDSVAFYTGIEPATVKKVALCGTAAIVAGTLTLVTTTTLSDSGHTYEANAAFTDTGIKMPRGSWVEYEANTDTCPVDSDVNIYETQNGGYVLIGNSNSSFGDTIAKVSSNGIIEKVEKIHHENDSSPEAPALVASTDSVKEEIAP